MLILVPILPFVLGKGDEAELDTDADVDDACSSIGGRRSLSISDLRLRDNPGQSFNPSDEQRVREKRGPDVRIVERLDGVLDALGTERERAVWESGRARDALELRYALRLLAIGGRAEGRSRKGKKGSCQWSRGAERSRYVAEEATVTHRSRENMCEMRPTARILFLITLRRSALSRSTGTTLGGGPSAPSLSSSSVHMLSTAANMSVTMGQDQQPMNGDSTVT